MAFLARRPSGRFEIREAVHTDRGPRSRTLGSFRGSLTREILDATEAKASRPFDRGLLIEKAEALGISVSPDRADPAGRALLARLRARAPIDPRLAALLRQALERFPKLQASFEFDEVAEWIGASEVERGRALRDVLRLYDAIARSREPVREHPPPRLPRFDSGARAAS